MSQMIIKNYVKNDYVKCMFVFDENIQELKNNCPHLVFDNEKIYLLNDHHYPQFFYQHIKSITISLCSRLMSYCGNHQEKFSLLSDEYWKVDEPILYFGHMGANLTYCLDMIIHYHDKIYAFESFSILQTQRIIKLLKKNHVCLNDPIHIENIVTTYHIKYELQHYLQLHYNELAQKYHLDNPRGQIIYS